MKNQTSTEGKTDCEINTIKLRVKNLRAFRMQYQANHRIKNQAGTTLDNNENAYYLLFKGSPEANFLLIDGIFVDCNRAALRIIGCTDRSQIIGKRPMDISATEQPDGSLSLVKSKELFRIPPHRNVHKFQWAHRTLKGDTILVEVSLTAFYTKDNEIVHAQWRDISEQTKIRRALLEKEEQYKGLVSTLPEIVLVHRDGIILFANQAVTNILGYHPVEMIGSPALNYVDEPYRLRVEQNADQRMKGVEIGEYEIKMLTKTNERVAMIVRAQKIVYSERPALLVVLFDITDRKKTEEQLRHSQKMEAVGQLAGGVAHDFNNILTAIMGYGSLLQAKLPQNDPLRSYVDTIMSSSDRAAKLTGSLLAFSRKQSITLMPIDLNKIIEGVEKLLVKLLTEDIELRIDLACEELIIMADTHQTEQVLMNLVANARDALPDGGKLRISTYGVSLDDAFEKIHGYGKPGRYAVVSVCDTGMGMDKKIRERVFEPFFTTKETGKGTGLGLSTVYGIVKQHDGYVTVDSTPHVGTTFNIYIPITDTKPLPIHEPAIHKSKKKGNETILIAEDHQEVRKLNRSILEDNGYTVIEAEDGQDAIDKFIVFKDSIRLAILDVVMPKKNGKEVYETINGIKSGTKTLFISGYTADIVNTKGIYNEGVDFIAKPMRPDHLLTKIREILDRQ